MIWDAVLIGICAWVFTHILIDEGSILSWWGELIWKLPSWLSRPLGECEYCLAGQLALWYYLYVNFGVYSTKLIIPHILFVTLTIFVVEIINIWKQK